MRRTERLSLSKRLTPARLLIYAVLIVVFIVTAYPFFYVLFLSVMPYENYVQTAIHALPSGFTLTYFEQILQDSRLLGAFQMSVLKTVVGTALSVVVTMMAGYALSRPQLKFGRVLTVLFLIPLFTNGGLIPTYLNFQSLGLLNTFWVLILPGLATPFNLFITRTFFRDFPQELIEAATIDGSGQFGTFWRVVWPTSTPIVATLAMLYGVAHWNEYFWPSILVQAKLQPASVLLQNIVSNRSVLQGLGLGVQMAPQSFIAAVAALLIIPVLVAYPFVQRYVVQGILLGSVKG
jgi:putative aldouronate transport system permease protein